MRIRNIKFNGFIISLFVAMLLAYLFPQGAEALALDEVTDIGISLIFFFYGLKLSLESFKSGLSNYRLHLLVQFSTFVLFPLLVLPFKPLMQQESTYLLWTGMFFLAVLPSTVSSSVIMVSIARGNVAGAIFNASISGLIGVLATPLWLGLVVNEMQSISFWEVFSKLMLQIVLPLALGVLLHARFGHIATRYSKFTGLFDKTMIALIVYSSFSASFLAHLFSGLTWTHFLTLYAAILALFFLSLWIIDMIAKGLNFSTEDRVTAMFCGSKKSLVHGSVMAKVIFGNSTTASMMILPIMLFHISQLVIIAFIAEKFSKKALRNAH
ncbi:bile acid:sodium symporter [Porifericola rhodea]|uniref:bile acid:sodium symporter family protein n=1 Tax=Porifericola rhodea TaxID=930972 RepID=UPI002665CAC9|nr:bile acid:sodium symporter family protein [Porifericola rhodea]WKN29905.1 bile acid:sodium symporter [Porifericola rhodea]